MSKSLSKIARDFRTAMKKHSPEILTGLGIVGMIGATVMAVKATPKAVRLIEQAKVENNSELTPVETIKTTWKCYIPAAVTTVVSAACLIGASSVNTRRNAALATAYTLSESALKTYQEKVVEVIGEKKERSVRDAVAKERIEQNPVVDREVIITGDGNTLCYDVIAGRYFQSNIEKIKKLENKLNHQLLNEMYVTLNEFYSELGLSPVKVGEELGWHIDRGYIELDFSSQLTENGTPCLVVDYRVAPRYDYLHA